MNKPVRLAACLAALSVASLFCSAARADESPATAAAAKTSRHRTGDVTYEPAAKENAPEQFRLPKESFPFAEETRSFPGDKIYTSRVTFPSPVVTPHAVNNTVHCEYYRPANVAPGEHIPAVIVLHILGGDFPLSRVFCNALAQQRCAALFVKMPYYGPRRPAGVNIRMISSDAEQTIAGMRQAILDIRRGRAFLASQSEVDPEQIGIFGISLGGITAALAASIEPRFSKCCPMLAGGDIAKVALESPELARVRREWAAKGQDGEAIKTMLVAIDPVTYAANLAGRKMLMLNASRDEVIPRACTDSLWNACGKPRIVWYNAGHISSLRYLPEGIHEVTTFFRAEKEAAGSK